MTRRQLIQRHIEGIRQRLPACIRGNPAGVMELFSGRPRRSFSFTGTLTASGRPESDRLSSRAVDTSCNTRRTHNALAHQHIGADHP